MDEIYIQQSISFGGASGVFIPSGSVWVDWYVNWKGWKRVTTWFTFNRIEFKLYELNIR